MRCNSCRRAVRAIRRRILCGHGSAGARAHAGRKACCSAPKRGHSCAGDTTFSFGDIRAVASDVLRHRILTNFRAEADRITAEDIIDRLLAAIQPPKAKL